MNWMIFLTTMFFATAEYVNLDKIEEAFVTAAYQVNQFGRAAGRDVEWLTRENEKGKWVKTAEKSFSLAMNSTLALAALPLHITLRTIASTLPTKRFKVIDLGSKESDGPVTILSINACLREGIYSQITGGVCTPFESVGGSKNRVIALAEWVGVRNPDIFVGQEFYDRKSQEVFIEELKKYGYSTFVIDFALHPFLVNSGLFVASKRKIGEISFIQFPFYHRMNTEIFSRRGALSFSILDSHGNSLLRVFNTHLNSGANAAWARKMQLNAILPAFSNPNVPSLLLGDFNFDSSQETILSPHSNIFEGQITCSDEGKRALRGTQDAPILEKIDALVVNSRHIEVRDPHIEQAKFGEAILSDHFGLSATVIVRK